MISNKLKNNLILSFATILLLNSCSTDEKQTVTTKTKLVMSDEFNVDGEPDPNIWSFNIGTGNGGWGNNELQYYTSRPENIKVEKDIIGKGNIGVAKNLYVGSGAKINNEGAAQFTSIRIGANSISWAPVKPEFGVFVKGDIVYNSEPTVGLAAGWICLESGNPGTWAAMAFVVQ
jgi:hypothetical protein